MSVTLFHLSNRTSYSTPPPDDERSRRDSQLPAGIVAPDVESTYQQADCPELREIVCIGPEPFVLAATLLYVHAISEAWGV